MNRKMSAVLVLIGVGVTSCGEDGGVSTSDTEGAGRSDTGRDAGSSNRDEGDRDNDVGDSSDSTFDRKVEEAPVGADSSDDGEAERSRDARLDVGSNQTTDARDSETEPSTDAGRCSGPLTFADPVIEQVVRAAARVPSGPIRPIDVQNVQNLAVSSAASADLHSLGGLECLPQLVEFAILNSSNHITDLSPLSSLVNLQRLVLWSCGGPVDVGQLAKLTNLVVLELENNCGIADLLPIYGLKELQILDFESNRISDLSQFLRFSKLRTLYVYDNPIDCNAQRASLAALMAAGVMVFSDCM